MNHVSAVVNVWELFEFECVCGRTDVCDDNTARSSKPTHGLARFACLACAKRHVGICWIVFSLENVKIRVRLVGPFPCFAAQTTIKRQPTMQHAFN